MAEPRRIQLKRTKGWKMPENTLKVDRSTGFGNPFPIVKCTSINMGVTTDAWSVGTFTGPAMWFRESREEAAELAVKAYRAWIAHPAQSSVRARAKAILKGKNLACWCRLDAKCHADVLLELANPPAKHGEQE